LKPKLLDLFCCQGGAGEGYRLAGFDVYAVDIDPQPRNPFPFYQGDALEVLRILIAGGSITFSNGETLRLSDFAAIHASPPCQLYSVTFRINRSDFPDLIAPTRYLLDQDGMQPYVIENVELARNELSDPVMLCGPMFGLETYRHRLFETNWPLVVPQHPAHVARNTKMGRRPVDGEFMHIVGNFSGVDRGREVMGMPWANRDGLREAIPPVYAEYVGTQLLKSLAVTA
jgi:DNA (cytosine-5)-methyltransferase 1